MKNYESTDSFSRQESEQLFHARAVFKEVFRRPAGVEAIRILRRMIRFHPKTDMEYAKFCGMQTVINMILDISEFFGDLDDNGRTQQ